MNILKIFRRLLLLGSIGIVAGCATQAPPLNYAAFIQAKPSSLLVLPPINDSPDVKASAAVWSHATAPLAEAGYYVLPVTLVDETFRQNGLDSPGDIHGVPAQKLRAFFGADAAVYLRVKRYGTSYNVISSETTVEVEGRLVDLRSGEQLWSGKAAASSAEQAQQNQGGIAGLLIAAVIKQIVGSVTDAGYNYAGIANQRLLAAPRYNGILPGPRSPNFGQPPTAAR